MSVRLNKLLAQRGVGARRKADALIQQGHVRVNGEVVREPGTQVEPQRDRVTVDGRPLPAAASLRYYVLNKPVGVITTLEDPEGRRTIRDLLPGGARLFPVGRLDADTSGLLILTNDGELAHHLMHPRYGVVKRYRVLLAAPPDPRQLDRLRRGVTIEPGVRTAPAEARVVDPTPGKAVLEIALHEGRYRQVRRMCEAVGLGVLALHRYAYGPLRLGHIARGMSRELSEQEVAALKATAARPVTRGIVGWKSPRASMRDGGRPGGREFRPRREDLGAGATGARGPARSAPSRPDGRSGRRMPAAQLDRAERPRARDDRPERPRNERPRGDRNDRTRSMPPGRGERPQRGERTGAPRFEHGAPRWGGRPTVVRGERPRTSLPRGSAPPGRREGPHGTRFERGERPQRGERPPGRMRLVRGERGGPPQRGERPPGRTRLVRGERGGPPQRGERPAGRTRLVRGERGGPPQRGERPPGRIRGERGDRPPGRIRLVRGERGERPAGRTRLVGERGERPQRGEHPQRRDAPQSRSGRQERPRRGRGPATPFQSRAPWPPAGERSNVRRTGRDRTPRPARGRTASADRRGKPPERRAGAPGPRPRGTFQSSGPRSGPRRPRPR